MRTPSWFTLPNHGNEHGMAKRPRPSADEAPESRATHTLPPGPWPVRSETRLKLSQDHQMRTAQDTLPRRPCLLASGFHPREERKEVRALSRARLCDPTDCSPPGSSVRGVLQARILEGAAMSFSRGSSRPGLEAGLPLCRQMLCPLSPQWEAEVMLHRGLRGGVRTSPLCA